MTTGTKIMYAWIASSLYALLAHPQELRELKTIYERNRADIENAYSKAINQEQTHYAGALEILKNLAIERKDLKQSSAAIAELDRFNKTKTLPPVPVPDQIPPINAAQSAYVQKSLQHELACAEKLGNLTAKYWEALTKLKKEMDKTGQTNEANSVSLECDNAVALLKRLKDQSAAIKESQCKEPLRTEAKKPLQPSTPGTTKPYPDSKTQNSKGDDTRTRLLDINSASKEDLIRLPGIGEKMADRIIAARPFRDKHDLTTVSGIGEKKFNDLKDLIQVDPKRRE